jgi:hypothetical protein
MRPGPRPARRQLAEVRCRPVAVDLDGRERPTDDQFGEDAGYLAVGLKSVAALRPRWRALCRALRWDARPARARRTAQLLPINTAHR